MFKLHFRAAPIFQLFSNEYTYVYLQLQKRESTINSKSATVVISSTAD